ncbi:MAG TPA: chemotaxis protein CheA [Desulfobacteria bacterium]|nr:chemotaxis protein CheA [Desulfobacteria bacterium]
MDMSQYLDTFLEEARENLQAMEKALLSLEASPENKPLLDQIFRSAHTLKGMSATMGYNAMAEVTHEIENILQKLRVGEHRLTTAFTDLLLKGVDLLNSMIGDISNEGNGDLPAEHILSLMRDSVRNSQKEAARETVIPPIDLGSPPVNREQRNQLPVSSINFNQYEKKLVMKAIDQGFQCYHLVVHINSSSTMKSARAFMIFRNLELAGEIVKSIPRVEDIEAERFGSSFELIVVSGEAPEVIRESLVSIAEVEEPEINTISEVINLMPDGDIDEGDSNIRDSAETTSGTDETLERAAAGTCFAHTVRVDKSKLDNLMNLVGELVISKTRLDRLRRAHNVPELAETFEQMSRVTSDLQDIVMKIRMVPIESVFSRFPRMVRDLARELGKEVEIVLKGEDTELDRTVIDEIGEPLLHLIRNAVDHGIEDSQTRAALGKTQQGLIKLSARYEGSHVIIEVEDDGKGINPEEIRKVAAKMGLAADPETEELDTESLISLVLKPGFTTAEAVTDISGRGVGLDVVRSKIEALSGTLQIQSVPASGTKFIIQLPLTLAIIQALLVSVENETYAIPLSFIAETTSVMPQEINKVQDQEFMFLRGSILPLKRLQALFEVPPSSVIKEPELNLVVVKKGSTNVGLIVDNLIGQQEIVIKPVSRLFGNIQVVAGATILGDGRVSLIIDVGGLL